jgi:polysaccharide pyruvyl transferase WcaK-like protein
LKNQVVGFYGQGNCGDDAFKVAFRTLYPNQDFDFFVPHGSLSPMPGARVILGGGDVIKSYYLDRIPMDQPFSIIGCGLGYTSEIDLLVGRKVELAVLRNRADAELARQRGINAVYAPDICFAIPPQAPQSLPESKKPKRLGVIMSNHAEPGTDQADMREAAYFEFFKWELARLLDELGVYYEIHWISFSADINHYDEAAHYSTRKKMVRRGPQYFWSYRPERPLDQVAILAGMDAVLTMKFHGAIFATLQGVPFVSIGLTRKLIQFCEESGLGEMCVKPYQFTYDTALAALKQAERYDTPDRLKAIAAENRRLLHEVVALSHASNPG